LKRVHGDPVRLTAAAAGALVQHLETTALLSHLDRPHQAMACACPVAGFLIVDVQGPQAVRTVVAIASVGQWENVHAAVGAGEPAILPVVRHARLQPTNCVGGVGFGLLSLPKEAPGSPEERSIHRASLESAITFGSSFIAALHLRIRTGAGFVLYRPL
jgi:hypothetical protein